MIRRRVARPPAFEHRNYRIFLSTQVVSVIGTWMQSLGQSWLVLVLSGDPFILGVVVAAQGLPIVGLGLIGGVVADRVEKRRLLLVTQGTMLVLALTLGLLSITGNVEVWHIVALAFGVGCVNAIDMPARQVFVVELVGMSHVASAVGLNSSVYSVGRLVGPAIAGFVIAAMTAVFDDPVRGTGVAFVMNASTYLVVLAGILAMRPADLFASDRVVAASRGVRAVASDIAEGLRYVRGSNVVLVTLLVPGLIATFAVNFGVLIPVVAHEAGLDIGGLGILMAAAGLGALASALWIGIGGGAGPRVIAAGALVLGVTEILIGVADSTVLLSLLLFIAGAGAIAMRTAANTTIQLATPPQLRGRVMSVFSIVFEGSSPMGGLLAGAIAAAASGRVAFVVSGVAAVALATVGARALARRSARGG